MLENYKEKLSFIENQIIDLTQRVIESNKFVLVALEQKELSKYKEATELLKNFSKIAHELDNEIVTILALYSPEAKDLRKVISFLKVTNELNRVAVKTRRYIKNISQNKNNEFFNNIILEYSIPMQKETISALEYSIEILKLDSKEEMKTNLEHTKLSENRTNELYAIVEKNMLKIICSSDAYTKDYLDVLISFRGLDKITDRALSIAKLLIFAKLGGKIH